MVGTGLCTRNCEFKTYEGYCKFSACIKRTETIKIPENYLQTVKLVELTDDCIERIADAVVQKLTERKEET